MSPTWLIRPPSCPPPARICEESSHTNKATGRLPHSMSLSMACGCRHGGQSLPVVTATLRLWNTKSLESRLCSLPSGVVVGDESSVRYLAPQSLRFQPRYDVLAQAHFAGWFVNVSNEKPHYFNLFLRTLRRMQGLSIVPRWKKSLMTFFQHDVSCSFHLN